MNAHAEDASVELEKPMKSKKNHIDSFDGGDKPNWTAIVAQHFGLPENSTKDQVSEFLNPSLKAADERLRARGLNRNLRRISGAEFESQYRKVESDGIL